MEWLAEQLGDAKKAHQKVIVFIHYRLDGGPGGPVNCTASTECGRKNNRAWVDDWFALSLLILAAPSRSVPALLTEALWHSTLKNAAVVRDVLEQSGVVLATFSGHDHVPIPPYTVAAAGHPMYFTHAGLVEGPHSNSNAYSIVDVMEDCSIVVTGFQNAS
eukprot:SAG31_NODE_9176_length_1320_cov_10.478296_2_plen_160_part_01